MPGTIQLSQPDSPAFEFKPYRGLSNEELAPRIDAVRAELGSRLLILGHHYQQDEVIALSDLRGDSYQLSQMAADSGDCRAIAFCGVHFMAETADIVGQSARAAGGARRRARDGRAARHGRRLLDGRHGRDRPGRKLLGRTGRGDRHRRHHAGHLHQLGRQPEGLLRPARRHRLHVEQRRGRARVGV